MPRPAVVRGGVDQGSIFKFRPTP